MGKAWYKFGAIAIPRTQNRYLLMLITISIVIGVVVLPIILQPSIAFFNLDDAYIYHKYALNLAQGHFLKYSINEPYTNGNTSFLYYLLYTLSVLIGNYITSFYSQSIQFVVIQIVVLIMNLLLFTIAYIYFIKIIDILRPSLQTKPLNKNSIESVGIGSILFLQSNVVIASFSGLEVALSVFLLTIILYMFLTYRWGGGLIFLSLGNFNRPEFLILSVIVNLYLFLFYKKDIKDSSLKVKLLSITSIITILAIPLMNKWFTGSIFLSSIARTNLKLLVVKDKLVTLLDSIIPKEAILSNIIISGIVLVILCGSAYFIFKLLSLERKKLSSNIFTTNISFCAIVVGAYSVLPIVASDGGAEWGRYFIPVLPITFLLGLMLLEIFLSKTMPKMKIAIMPMLLVGSLIPYYNRLLELVDARSVYSMLLPMAKKLAEAEYNDSKIMIDQAGLLSLFTQGTVIDIYGLGTQRYAAVHGDMDSVGRLIRNDKPNYFVAWKTIKPTYYLDTAWYEHIFENESVELQEILSINNHHRMKTDKFATFPKEMSLYKVIYK